MRSASFVAILLLAACATEGAKGPEEDAPSADGKDDSLRKPTDHGAIGFDDPRTESLTGSAGHHAWVFTLSAEATVDIFTGAPVAGDEEVDTVLYLYRQRDDGSWGPYIARNDDSGGTLWSSIDRTLQAGAYRVTVKGYDRWVRGAFAVTVQCDGAGCAPPVASCVLGGTYGEIEQQPALQVLGRQVLTASSWLSVLDRQRVVVAVQQSSHTDVTTPEEAFARVDQGEINQVFILEPLARRRFVAFEYGAGDNSYGAVFGDRTTEVVASIHDGDLLGCATPAGACVFPEDYRSLLADPGYQVGTARVVHAAGELSALEAQQVLLAGQESYDDVASAADVLARVDGGAINLQPITHRDTGTALLAVEYGAGDTSVGLVFYAGGTEVAASISDLWIGACSFFQ